MNPVNAVLMYLCLGIFFLRKMCRDQISVFYMVPYSIMLVSLCVLYCAISELVLYLLYNTHYCYSTNKFNENDFRKIILVTIAPVTQNRIPRINLVKDGINLYSENYEIMKKKE